MLNNAIKTYLRNLDQEQKGFVSDNDEHDIAKVIKNILVKKTNYKPTIEDIAEQMAFNFMAEYPTEDASGWGTYYGPMFILPNQEGQMIEYPSIQMIDEKILEYWEKRAKETTNPILSARYADLVIDFSPKVIDKRANIDLFHIVIDSNLSISEKLLANPLDCKTKIKRALLLAIGINDQFRISRIKDTILKLEKNIAVDDKPGLWGFAFEWLILEFSKKVTLTEIEKLKLVQDLEERLCRVKTDSWGVECIVTLLAEYYAKERDEINLMRILDVLENSLKTNDRSNSDALLKTHAYEQIHEIYQKYAKYFPEARKASKRLAREIGQLDLDWEKSLKEISVTTKINQKDLDNFLEAIFGDKEQIELEMIVHKIVINFLPRKESVEKQLKDISKKYPIQFSCTKQVISDDGVLIAKLSTLNEDYDNHFQSYALQYIQLGSFFLSLTMDELRKKFSKDQILEYFEKSVVFENENKEYLKRAISAYWDEDYLVSSHLFNPLIESGVRELIKICDGIVLKPNSLNGYNNVLLKELLKNEQIFENVFLESGHNVSFYFRLVLIEKLGMNLRNDFAHGFGKKKFFTKSVSDRLLHIMLCLSLVKQSGQDK